MTAPDWDDELWRVVNPGASAFRGALVAAAAGVAVWVLLFWAVAAVIA